MMRKSIFVGMVALIALVAMADTAMARGRRGGCGGGGGCGGCYYGGYVTYGGGCGSYGGNGYGGYYNGNGYAAGSYGTPVTYGAPVYSTPGPVIVDQPQEGTQSSGAIQVRDQQGRIFYLVPEGQYKKMQQP